MIGCEVTINFMSVLWPNRFCRESRIATSGSIFGVRYNFVQPGSRLIPYFSGGLGLGWIDSHANIPGGQGQDFTFNILTAAGVSYKVSDQWNISVGILYQHLSNAGQTDPNPSLNLLGPQVAISYSF